MDLDVQFVDVTHGAKKFRVGLESDQSRHLTEAEDSGSELFTADATHDERGDDMHVIYLRSSL